MADGGNHFRQDASSTDSLVPRGMACLEPEERGNRFGTSTPARYEALRDGLDNASQASAGDGPP
jgi:hypothetical protein